LRVEHGQKILQPACIAIGCENPTRVDSRRLPREMFSGEKASPRRPTVQNSSGHFGRIAKSEFVFKA
jgi:hypothetical protein